MIAAATRKTNSVVHAHHREPNRGENETRKQRSPLAQPLDDRPDHRRLIDRRDADERERQPMLPVLHPKAAMQ